MILEKVSWEEEVMVIGWVFGSWDFRDGIVVGGDEIIDDDDWSIRLCCL